MKPSKELREKYYTNYNDRTDFAAQARLLQSIWREEQGYSFEKYGNFLEEKFAWETGANFLTTEIFEIVKYEVANKHKSNKVIKEPRIWSNLLSSQPLAFNLFGELKLDLKLATSVFKNLYPNHHIKNVSAIEFEYSPGRKSLQYTGDSSAFDVFIEYNNVQDQSCFFGIEVKYAENLLDDPASHKKTYEEISIQSGIFNMDMLDKLKEKPIQQIWRDHLLVLSMFIKNKDYKTGDFIYLYPELNDSCVEGIKQYSATFRENTETYLISLTIEKLINYIKKYCAARWVTEFEDRYLAFKRIGY